MYTSSLNSKVYIEHRTNCQIRRVFYSTVWIGFRQLRHYRQLLFWGIYLYCWVGGLGILSENFWNVPLNPTRPMEQQPVDLELENPEELGFFFCSMLVLFSSLFRIRRLTSSDGCFSFSLSLFLLSFSFSLFSKVVFFPNRSLGCLSSSHY